MDPFSSLLQNTEIVIRSIFQESKGESVNHSCIVGRFINFETYSGQV